MTVTVSTKHELAKSTEDSNGTCHTEKVSDIIKLSSYLLEKSQQNKLTMKVVFKEKMLISNSMYCLNYFFFIIE